MPSKHSTREKEFQLQKPRHTQTNENKQMERIMWQASVLSHSRSRKWECQVQPCRMWYVSIHRAMPRFSSQVDNKFLLWNFLSDYKIFVSNSACYSFSDHRCQTEVVKIIAVFEIAPHINMLSRCERTQNTS